MRVSEECNLIPMIESKDYGSVGVDAASVSLKGLTSLAAVLVFGAITGDSVLKVYLGAASGAKTTAIAFKYRLGAADYKAALADQLGDAIDVASTGLTLAAATFDHRQLVIEVDTDAVVLEGKPWLTIEISAVATVLNVGAVGIGPSRTRGHLLPSAV